MPSFNNLRDTCRVGRVGRVREGDCLHVSSIVDSPWYDQFLSGPDVAHIHAGACVTPRSRRGPSFDLSYHPKFHLPMNFWLKCFPKMYELKKSTKGTYCWYVSTLKFQLPQFTRFFTKIWSGYQVLQQSVDYNCKLTFIRESTLFWTKMTLNFDVISVGP